MGADAEKRIGELLGLPPPSGWCGGTKPMRLRSREDPKERIMRMSCRSWKCLVCRETLKRRAGQHFGLKLLMSSGMLFEQESLPEAWATDQKRLKRMKASWVRIGCAGQPGVIIGSAEPPFGRAITDWEMAVSRLGKALRELVPVWKDEESYCRPISCSRDWTPPKKPPKYERVGWVRCAKPEELVDAIRGVGLSARFRPADDKGLLWDVSYEIPDQDAERMADLEAALAEVEAKRACGCRSR